MTPRFLIDACLPRGTASVRDVSVAYDCALVIDRLGDGATDAEVTALAIAEARIVVTADIGDFSTLWRTPNLPGTILVDQAATPHDTIQLAQSGMRHAAALLNEGKSLQRRLIRVRSTGRIALR